MKPRHFAYLAACAIALSVSGDRPTAATGEKHLLYAAVPGIRNYLEYGGIGLLVYDMDDGHRLVRRIPTFALEPGVQPENVKGIAANARTGLIYVSTIRRVAAFDLTTDKMVWNRTYEGGADRIALSPDGAILYVPSLEGPHWHAVNAKTGDVLAKIVTDSGAHPLDRRSRYSQGRRRRRTVQQRDPAVHDQQGADPVLRQRQRSARLRGRRHQDRQDAAPRAGPRLRSRADQAAWLSQPRRRPDAG
jgi:hypothetical protein